MMQEPHNYIWYDIYLQIAESAEQAAIMHLALNTIITRIQTREKM